MSDTKHTPGPYYLCENGHIRQLTSDYCLARTEDGGHPEKQLLSDDEMQANGFLFSAAPDLLQALESAFEQAIEEGVSTDLPMAQMGKAIAKARGES